MARYIDADKFIERLKASPAFPNMGMDGYFLLDVVENLLKNFPTADVAPKSEVAEEIIENVRALLRGWCNSCYPLDVVFEKLVELKKKYTGADNDT